MIMNHLQFVGREYELYQHKNFNRQHLTKIRELLAQR